MSGQQRHRAESTRQHRLIVEAELPDFWVGDLIEICREFGAAADGGPLDITRPTEELLHEIGDVFDGLLTIEISGEKDSTVEHDVPILFRRAWVEAEPPSDPRESSLVARERERRAEQEAELADAKATVRAFHRLIRDRVPDLAGELAGEAIDAGQEAYDTVWSKHFTEEADHV